MKARLSEMRERLRRWLWGDLKKPQNLPDEIERAFRRLDKQSRALHEAVTAMHEKRGANRDWGL